MRWTISLIAAVFACVWISGPVGGESNGLEAVWEFEAIHRGIITTESICPGDAAWGGFKSIPNPFASDYADVSQGHGVTFTALAPLDPSSAGVAILNDGKGQINDNSPASSLFFARDSKVNRILIDLKGLQPVYQVNTLFVASDGTQESKTRAIL
ncbi:MAG: hypothetical protein OEV87_11190 [Phycisphaerae bacterium]|nr:hypothetical protein [Phycisphaerae bacterium]